MGLPTGQSAGIENGIVRLPLASVTVVVYGSGAIIPRYRLMGTVAEKPVPVTVTGVVAPPTAGLMTRVRVRVGVLVGVAVKVGVLVGVSVAVGVDVLVAV
jgi:hypothetical protein